jgi:hypothetical protein
MKKRTIDNKAKALQVIRLNKGIIAPALKSVGISRTQFYQWLKIDKLFESRYQNILDEVQMLLISKIANQVQKQNPKAYVRLIKCVLKKKDCLEKNK